MAFDEQNQDELDELMHEVYDELRKLASSALKKERHGHTLQTTALVHEAYLRLADLEQIRWQDEDHVLRAAVGCMRRILVDSARKKRAKKRDVEQLKLTCPEGAFRDYQSGPDVDVLALDEALGKLREIDPVKAQLVELRYFGGQKLEEVARILGISLATVKRHWTFSRAWLNRELSV